jgi:hypothetical protein
MAEGKKSFLIHTDTWETVQKLSDKEAGQFFKHMLMYVNDMNPEPPSKWIDIVFEPFKQALKRDLQKWETEKGKKKEGGAMGNLKRWNPDLYESVNKGLITLEDAQKVAKSRIVSHSDNNLSHSVAPVAVNVNDNVSVNVNDINNLNKNGADEINSLKLPENHKTRFGITFSDLEPVDYLKIHETGFFESVAVNARLSDADYLAINDRMRYVHHKDLNHFQNAFRASIKSIKNTEHGKHQKHFNGTKSGTTVAIESGRTKSYTGAKM